MIYCDTSLLVAALTEETGSLLAVDWLGRQPAGMLAISGWNLTEVASAVAMKRARGEIDDREAALITAGWAGLQARLRYLGIADTAFARAATLANETGLRSGDALHLAVVLEHNCQLATFDLAMAAAARTLGVAVHPTS